MGKRRGGYGRCSSFTLAPRLVPIAFFRVLVYKSPRLLYNPHIATMEADPTKAYNQSDATGFIRLNALRLKVATQVHKGAR